MNNYLKEMLVALTRDNVRFVVCGGVAMVIQGFERMTVDLDISLDLGRDNIMACVKVMKELGLSPRVPVPAESLADPEMRKVMIRREERAGVQFP